MNTQHDVKDLIKTGIIILLTLWIFGSFCPLEKIVGIPCPGCNMFTAMYYLLIKFDYKMALYYHPLVIFCLLYMIILAVVFIIKGTIDLKIIKYLSVIAITLLLIVYIYRMINIFPEYPMTYNEKSFLNQLLKMF